MTKNAGGWPFGAGFAASQQVSWWATRQFLESMLAQANHGPLPAAGTADWCALSDGDPRKLLALAAAGEHWVLRIETGQEQSIQALQDIASGIDCRKLASQIARNERPWGFIKEAS